MGIYNFCHEGSCLKWLFRGQTQAVVNFLAHVNLWGMRLMLYLWHPAASCFLHFNVIWVIYVLLVLTDLSFPPYAPLISLFISAFLFLALHFISFPSTYASSSCLSFLHSCPQCNSVSWNIQRFNTLFTFLYNPMSMSLAFRSTIPLKNIWNRCWIFRGGGQKN